MQFRIADTFTDNLAKLSNDEQKAVKTTAFDLQLNQTNPGMQFHKIERAKDPNFWSVRVNSDIRLIVHKTRNNLMLCYVSIMMMPIDGRKDENWKHILKPVLPNWLKSEKQSKRSPFLYMLMKNIPHNPNLFYLKIYLMMIS